MSEISKQSIIDQINALTVGDDELTEQEQQYLINWILAGGKLTKNPRDLIQIRKGLKKDLPRFAIAELGLTLDEEKLYVGGENGNIPIPTQREISDIGFNVKSFGAKGDGVTDDTQIINDCIKEVSQNGGGSVLIPKGVYIVTSDIRLYKNVTIFGYGATIKPIGSDNKVFINGERGNENYASHYNGDGNIHIYGLTVDLNCGDGRVSPNMTVSAFDLGHGENISFTDVKITNGQIGHYIQVSGCKNVRFKNCLFGDINITSTDSFNYEIIQIEAISENSFPTFGSFDLTPSMNVTIEDCVFDGVIRAVGTHGTGKYGTENYIYCENISITNSIIKNCSDSAVYFTAYKNVVFNNNNIENVEGSGVAYRGLDTFNISGNVFSNIQKSVISGTDISNGTFGNNIVNGVALHSSNKYACFRATNSNNVMITDLTVSNQGNNYSFTVLIDGISSDNKANNIIAKVMKDYSLIRGVTNLDWCSIGDSITDGNETHGYYQDTSLLFLPQINIHYKRGYGGHTVAISSDSSYNSINEKLDEIPVSDIYTVLLGTNDFSRNVPIGSLTDATGKTDSFYGGLKELYIGLTGKKMDSFIVFITPPKRTATPNWSTTNEAGHKLVDYVNAIKEFCETYSLPVIDLFNESGVSNRTASTFLHDGLHFRELGNKHIGAIIGKNLNNYIL